MNFHGQWFRTGVITVPTASASLSSVLGIMVTTLVNIFTHFEDTGAAGEDATFTCFTFQFIEYWIWFFFMALHDSYHPINLE